MCVVTEKRTTCHSKTRERFFDKEPLTHLFIGSPGLHVIDQKSTLTARQKIGHGLRLCVDQNGERIEDCNINLLQSMT